MFERFTDRARRVVVLAQEIARERGDDRIGSEHLLLAAYGVPENLGLVVLTGFSITQADVEADLAEPAGADVDAVRARIEETFGRGTLGRARGTGGRRGWWPWTSGGGHIPFTKDAKKVMELSLREALRLQHNYIGVEHVVLGMLHDRTGVAGKILLARGARLDVARTIVEELAEGRRAG